MTSRNLRKFLCILSIKNFLVEKLLLVLTTNVRVVTASLSSQHRDVEVHCHNISVSKVLLGGNLVLVLLQQFLKVHAMYNQVILVLLVLVMHDLHRHDAQRVIGDPVGHFTELSNFLFFQQLYVVDHK